MIPKEWVLDRIEQSFEVFKNNFLNIFAPMVIYNFITSIVIWNIIYYYWISFFDFNSIWNSSDINKMMADAFGSTSFVIGVNIFIILILLKLIFVVVFIIATIKWVKQSYEWTTYISYIDNIKYWFKNLSNSFKTYWYMFVYVALLPSILLIIWWILFISWKVINIDILLNIWTFIFWFSVILLLFFAIYRWFKTTFSIPSAVDHDEYNQSNFDNSVLITNNNWLRIVWNFILLSIIIWIIWSIVNWIIWIFQISNFDFSIFTSLSWWKLTPDKIQWIVTQLTNSMGNFSISDFIISILKMLIETLFSMFSLVFVYIFYKRLEIESWLWLNIDTKNDINVLHNEL